MSSIQRGSHALFHNLHTEYNTVVSTPALEAALLILTRRSASTTSKALPTGSCRGHAAIRRRWGLDEESDQGHRETLQHSLHELVEHGLAELDDGVRERLRIRGDVLLQGYYQALVGAYLVDIAHFP